MNHDELVSKIIQKKELSQLPLEDVEKALGNFEKRQTSEEEKVKLTRELLHDVFSGFTSRKLLNVKDKNPEWILNKHLSTRERFVYYNEIYGRILKNVSGEVSIYDFGAGVNGFSYIFLKEINKKIHYYGVEAVGQLVDLMNFYFKKNNFSAKAFHNSLFNLEEVKKILKNDKGKKIVFLFKVIDSLEMLERDYSKKFLTEIRSLADLFVVSFATRSMIKRKSFNVNRKWFFDFVEKEFKIIDDFEIGGEMYLVFEKK